METKSSANNEINHITSKNALFIPELETNLMSEKPPKIDIRKRNMNSYIPRKLFRSGEPIRGFYRKSKFRNSSQMTFL